MATGRGAGLLSASRSLMGLAGQVPGHAGNIRQQRRQKVTNKQEDELFQLGLAKAKTGAKREELSLQTEQAKASEVKKSAKLGEDIQVRLAQEKARREAVKATDKVINSMPKTKLDAEYGTFDPEEAKKLAYTDLIMPSGKTNEQIIQDEFGPQLAASQFVGRGAQGLQQYATQGIKRLEEKEAAEISGKAKVQAQEAKQGFVTSERKATQDYDAQQKALDRASREAMAAAKASTTATKPPSSKSFEAATFGLRIKDAEDALARLGAEGFDPTTFKARVMQKGNVGGIKNPQERQYAQALKNFINATLRRESGAAIAESEFTNAMQQYFPQLGDDPQTLQQRKANRQRVQAGMLAEGGEAVPLVQQKFQEISGTPAVSTPGTTQRDFGKEYGF